MGITFDDIVELGRKVGEDYTRRFGETIEETAIRLEMERIDNTIEFAEKCFLAPERQLNEDPNGSGIERGE